ncbi:hypothetical protein EPUL_006301, partial [Erysiphe pulchra]
MLILTAALYVILLSILGGSKTAHADREANQDAFGVTDYGFQCFDRVYPKYAIYAAAKRYCDLTNRQQNSRYLGSKHTGYRNRFYFRTIGGDIDNIVNEPWNTLLPILQDGTLYPFEVKPELRLVKNSAGEMVRIDPGPDRLIIDLECNIIGAFSDLDYKTDPAKARVQTCTILESMEDNVRPLVSSSSPSS